MSKEKEDLGLGDAHVKNQKRALNKDGSFNTRKIGGVSGVRDLYQHLIKISWGRFLLGLLSTYVSINLIFALAYFLLGEKQFNGLEGSQGIDRFLECFFFSTQTFATVGYGAISPSGIFSNFIASFESFVGLLSFALATGLLFGRFSKPNAKLFFTNNVLISPYKESKAGLMFRVVNRRNNTLLEASAEVILSYSYTDDKGKERRTFKRLALEISEIKLFPTTWTIVHPIDEESPFYEKSERELKDFQFEILVLVKAFDETFGQDVYARSSYTNNELVYKAKFNSPHFINERGETEVNLNTLGEYKIVDSLGINDFL